MLGWIWLAWHSLPTLGPGSVCGIRVLRVQGFWKAMALGFLGFNIFKEVMTFSFTGLFLVLIFFAWDTEVLSAPKGVIIF